MDDAWGPTWTSRLRKTLDTIEKNHETDWTRWELQEFLKRHQRMDETTVDKYLRQLDFMANYEAQPVTLHGSRMDLVESFWLYFRTREDFDEDAGSGALINDVKAVRSLGKFLRIPPDVWPKPPPTIHHEDRWLPSPEQVHDLLHTQYGPNPKRNPLSATVRYMLMVDFAFGLRFPSEAHMLDIWDVDLEGGTLTVTEPKKGNRRRCIVVEPEWLLRSPNRLCLENWVKVWWEKHQPATDSFFPNPTGENKGDAFPSKERLAQFLNEHVKPEFPWFKPYLGRHWCATARLIEWDHDYDRVADWLGHVNTKRVRNTYGREARVFEKKYGDNWLTRAFYRRHV